MLRTLDFTDLYIKQESAYIRGVNLEPNPHPIEFNEVKELKSKCDEVVQSKAFENSGGSDFAVHYDDVHYRGSVISSIDGVVYVLRKQPHEVKKLSELIKVKQYVDQLLNPDLKGLVLIVGGFGQGKSWTASGMVAERLEIFGGVAATFEDPPELPLHGMHGNGICFQTNVNKKGFEEAIHSASRWAPDILYFSEIRDADSSVEALKAAQNGKLSITTIHGDSPISGIERLFNMAASANVDHSDIANLMANGLAIVLHQELRKDGDRVFPQITWLAVNSEISVKSIVKDRKWNHLNQEINQQKNQLLMK